MTVNVIYAQDSGRRELIQKMFQTVAHYKKLGYADDESHLSARHRRQARTYGMDRWIIPVLHVRVLITKSWIFMKGGQDYSILSTPQKKAIYQTSVPESSRGIQEYTQ